MYMLLICWLYVGPIPDNNPGWKLAAYIVALAAGARHYDIKAADIAATPPPNPAEVLNKENIGVYVGSEYTKGIVIVY
jgi:hypothetical protein